MRYRLIEMNDGRDYVNKLYLDDIRQNFLLEKIHLTKIVDLSGKIMELCFLKREPHGFSCGSMSEYLLKM